MARTRLSAEGEITIPAGILERNGWAEGEEIDVETRGDTVVLRRPAVKRLFPPTRLEDVIGCVRWDGPPAMLDEMDASIGKAAREMWDKFERGTRGRR
jgi:AbrB family looped-hinge helix DNA binding protein